MNKYKAKIEQILDVLLENTLIELKNDGRISISSVDGIETLIHTLKELDKKTKK